MKKFDYIIIGSGIVGLTLAYTLKKKNPSASIVIIDKENEEAFHASSRNSGVLHAGFYYTADSLKAKFTVAGNKALRAYCFEKGIAVNTCGKLVVAQNADELEKLHELYKRGVANGSNVCLVDEAQAKSIEPNIRTFKKALYSPDTASVNPKEVCHAIKQDLESMGVVLSFNTAYLSHVDNVIETSQGTFEATKKIINCAGLYADKIAHGFGFGKKYTIIPFKGLYLKYTKNKTDININIYPVPNLKNPFLGVHFTKTSTGEIKIGPTAIPAFWRENYTNERFKLDEFLQIGWEESKLFTTNAFGFRDLAFEEIRKYNKKYFVQLAQALVQHIDPDGFTEWTKPGIRAQLLDKTTSKLLQDFVIEGDAKSTHILNAVSPAFTCSFPFAEYIVEKFIIADQK